MLFGPSENCEAAAESLKNQLMEFDKELQKRGDFFGGKAMIKTSTTLQNHFYYGKYYIIKQDCILAFCTFLETPNSTQNISFFSVLYFIMQRDALEPPQ